MLQEGGSSLSQISPCEREKRGDTGGLISLGGSYPSVQCGIKEMAHERHIMLFGIL